MAKPQQKNGRNRERMPSVLTSDQWLAIQQAKETEINEKERKKNERKTRAILNKQKKLEQARSVKEKKLAAKQKKAEKLKKTKRSKITKRKQKQSTTISSEDEEEWIASGDSFMDISYGEIFED